MRLSEEAIYSTALDSKLTVTRDPCTPGTRNEVLGRIFNWAEDASPSSPSVFWLSGPAGSGKSTIAFTVAEQYDRTKEHFSKDILRATFFCSRQLESASRQVSIIPTLAHQIAQSVSTYAEALIDSNPFSSVKTIHTQMKTMLVDPWESSLEHRPCEIPPYLIIVDALDEITDGSGSNFLFQLLTAVKEGHLKGLKFLVTSRPESTIASQFNSKNSTILHLERVDTIQVVEDITVYLRTNLPTTISDTQIHTLSEKSDGLFIFAATAVRLINPRPKLSQAAQVHRLNALLGRDLTSKTSFLIDEMYREVMNEALGCLDEDMFSPRLKIIHTILCARAPLTCKIIGELLANDDLDEDSVEDFIKTLHAVLYIKNGYVFWYHASFQDYMLTQQRSGSAHCDKVLVHTALAGCCFAIMNAKLEFNICRLTSMSLFDSDVPDLEDLVKTHIHPALVYSCHFWSNHLDTSTANNTLYASLSVFIRERALFWIEVMNLLGLGSQCTADIRSSQLYAAKVCLYRLSPSHI